jgi:hypothetical protein
MITESASLTEYASLTRLLAGAATWGEACAMGAYDAVIAMRDSATTVVRTNFTMPRYPDLPFEVLRSDVPPAMREN